MQKMWCLVLTPRKKPTAPAISGCRRLSIIVLFIFQAEEEGFEPPRGVTRLSVFKTDPFSQTWVFLHFDKKDYNLHDQNKSSTSRFSTAESHLNFSQGKAPERTFRYGRFSLVRPFE